MGSGFSSVVRSLLNAFIKAHHQAMLNSLLGVLQYVAVAMAAPMLSRAMQAGIAMGGAWMGLPFLVAAACAATAAVIVFLFRLPPPEGSAARPRPRP